MALIIGHIGSDAGYTVIGADGTVHHVPGWGEGQLADFSAALRVVQTASQIKAPGIGAAILKSARTFLETEFKEHVRAAQGDQVLLIVDSK